MTTEFMMFGLREELLQAIEERGYETPTEIQAQIIPLMIEANDVQAQSQTGTGKTAAFALPILNVMEHKKQVQCLVLAPTRELVMQVTEIMKEYGKYTDIKVLSIYGGDRYDRQIRGLNKGADVVVGTPGRLLDLLGKGILDLSNVRHVVLDEADEMLSMGFIEDVETILEAVTVPHQTALFSATLPKRIVELSQKYLYQPVEVKIVAKRLTVDAIEQRCYMVNNKDKIAALTRLFEVEDITSALIFTKTRKSTGEVANELTQRGYPAEAISGELPQEARIRVLDRFKNKQIKVLVATDVAARGLDIDDISHVFNYDLPYEEEAYVHRIGRTGRAGKSGIAITLITPKEEYRVRRLQQYTKAEIKQFPIPTKEEIVEHRNQALMEDLNKWLGRDRCKQELAMVMELAEQGHDPLMIAAVALKLARAGERQRPIFDISLLKRGDSRKRNERSGRNDRYSRDKRGKGRDRKDRPPRDISKESHESGMVRLRLNVGKSHDARPRDIVGMLAYQADIPGKEIGKIFIEKKHTFVDVPEARVGEVMAKSGQIKLHKYEVEVSK